VKSVCKEIIEVYGKDFAVELEVGAIPTTKAPAKAPKNL
jgi:hypothetical protein